MDRQPTRTDLVEEHGRKISELNITGFDFRTLARAYADISEQIAKLTTKGDIWDTAQEDLVVISKRRADEYTQRANLCFVEARKLEDEGVPL
jgi:hypothetical protein